MQAAFTNSVIDGGLRFPHCAGMITHDQIRDELIRRIDAREVTGAGMARLLGIAPARITEIKNGDRRVQQREIEKLAEFFGLEEIPPPRAVNRDIPDHLPTRPIEDGTVEITALDLSVSMGPGTLIEGFVESEPVRMDVNVLRSVTRAPFEMLRVIKGTGDSMEPTLRTNDRVLIDTSERTMSRMHGVYWIDYEGAHGLKRLRPAGKGRIKIISDNEDAGDTFEVNAEEIRIYGRAIMFWRDL